MRRPEEGNITKSADNGPNEADDEANKPADTSKSPFGEQWQPESKSEYII